MVARWLVMVLLGSCGMLPAGVIRLKTREIRTELGLPEPAGNGRRTNTRVHAIVEFRSRWDAGLLAKLKARRITVSSAVGNRALMLGIPDGVSLAGLGVDWTGPLRTTDKLSPELARSEATNGTLVVEFHSDVRSSTIQAILRAVGAVELRAPRMLAHQRLIRASPRVLRQLPEWDEVAYLFPAASHLSDAEGPRPCSGALVQGLVVAQYVTEGTGWASRSQYGVSLGYVFTTLTDKVPTSEVQTEILRAMHAWTAVTNVQFNAGVNATAATTVAIEFGTSVNGDPLPFDPGGTTLAHTYYPDPPNGEPIAGDMHFNPAENWNVGANTDIYTVALHELGHALGLGHTDNPADVMYPYYRFGSQLSANDIAGVQSLYGTPGGPVPAPGGGNMGGGVPETPGSPLSVIISSPANGLQTGAASATLAGSLGNASGPASVNWRSSSGAAGAASGSPNWTTPAIPLAQGINLITVTATAGAQQSASSLIRILQTGVANSPPPGSPPPAPPPAPAGVVIDSPVNGAVVSGTTVQMTGTASDPSGIGQVTWLTNSGATGTATGTTSWVIPSIPVYPGQNVVIVEAKSNAGTMKWSSVEITKN